MSEYQTPSVARAAYRRIGLRARAFIDYLRTTSTHISDLLRIKRKLRNGFAAS
ncbi:MAG TPA: hypothetical protein VES69_12850 [Pyrinomonadaceae bacterium]|nr:hypothetical protein [Pyrinomonadaceae bacterium]